MGACDQLIHCGPGYADGFWYKTLLSHKGLSQAVGKVQGNFPGLAHQVGFRISGMVISGGNSAGWSTDLYRFGSVL